jgi:transposase-like protein
VDQDDNVLDILVQRRRKKQAAKKFFRTLLKGLTSVVLLKNAADATQLKYLGLEVA